jgi:hypothetical protein
MRLHDTAVGTVDTHATTSPEANIGLLARIVSVPVMKKYPIQHTNITDQTTHSMI